MAIGEWQTVTSERSCTCTEEELPLNVLERGTNMMRDDLKIFGSLSLGTACIVVALLSCWPRS